MYVLRNLIGSVAVFTLGMLVCATASATPTVMNFDGMANAQNGEYVNNFYNGGCGGSYAGNAVDCNGPNYGVVWNGAIAGGAPNGLYSNVNKEPSNPNTMGFDGNNAIMNVAAGFDTGFSFYYAAPFYTGVITVYSDLNGNGSVLATLDLPTTSSNCDGTVQNYSCWDPIGVTFSGTARSVAFGGTARYIVYDDVTIGAGKPGGSTSVPEPAELGMFGLGLMLIGLFAGLRRRAVSIK